MQDKDAIIILERYLAGIATDEEKALVETWYLKNPPTTKRISDDRLAAHKKDTLKNILANVLPKSAIKIWPRFTAVASFLLFVSISVIYFYHYGKKNIIIGSQGKIHAVLPGRDLAVLTLSNGKKIDLARGKNGQIAHQGKIVINKSGGNEIVYQARQSSRVPDILEFNTLTTPRGGQFHLVLPDGTNVWLNAASSIKYPIEFSGKRSPGGKSLVKPMLKLNIMRKCHSIYKPGIQFYRIWVQNLM